MSIYPLTVLAALGCAVSISSAQNARPPQPLAQPLAQPVERINLLTQQAPTAYEDQMVVLVTITIPEQLDAALALSESAWTERPGLGNNVLQIHRDNLEALTQLGINPVVQIADLRAHNQQQWEARVSRERIDQQNHAGAFRPMEQIQRGASSHDENWFTSYKQLADIYAYMDTQITAHPDLISKADFGDTIEGRDMLAYTITAPDAPGNLASDRPVILWNGGQHAREWVSPMTVTYIASKLIDEIDTDPEVGALMNSVRFVIVPVTNPDGYLYTWSSQRYWRKNRRDNPGTSSDGVDLNRNWNIAFGGDGTSSDPSSDVYHGTGPFSEPETAALSALGLSYGDDLASHIDYHTFSQLILWPLGYADNLVTPEPDRTNFIDLSGDISALIQSFSGVFYNPIQSWQLYPAAGTASDWFYDGAGVPSFTIELRPDENNGIDGFSPPDSEILPTARENWEAAKLFAVRTTQPISISHDPVGIVDADTPSIVYLSVAPGISEVDPSAVTLYARVGDSGPYSAIAMIDNGPSGFVAHLPDAPCGDIIEYYFTASSISGATLTYPVDGASSPLTALSQLITIAVDDTMEFETGWSVGQPSDTATTGVWQRADPEFTEAQPEDDHTPGAATLCWVTGASTGGSLGGNDIDGGATTLTSPTLDGSGAGDGAELVYWRWYSNDTGAEPNSDTMLVQISQNDGASWSTLETVNENAHQWVEKRFDLSSIATQTDQLRLRFIASDLGSGSIVEAAIDDLRIESIGCPSNVADLNGDGELDFLDISAFLAFYGQLNPAADLNNDGNWDFLDISAFLAAYNAG